MMKFPTGTYSFCTASFLNKDIPLKVDSVADLLKIGFSLLVWVALEENWVLYIVIY